MRDFVAPHPEPNGLYHVIAERIARLGLIPSSVAFIE